MAKQYAPTDDSSTRANQWCSHLVNASKVVLATALWQFLVTGEFNFQHKASY